VDEKVIVESLRKRGGREEEGKEGGTLVPLKELYLTPKLQPPGAILKYIGTSTLRL